MSKVFSWTSKKKIPCNPPPLRKCCIVCFKVITEERYGKKRCEACEGKPTHMEPKKRDLGGR